MLMVLSLLTILPACQGLKPALITRSEESRLTPGLDQAWEAWQVMQQEAPGSLAAQQALLQYNRSVEQVVKSLRHQEQTNAWGQEFSWRGTRPWRVTFDSSMSKGSKRNLLLSAFSGCQPAAEVKLQGFDRVVLRSGLGVPVVLSQTEPQRAAHPFHSTDGEFIPATAVLAFPSTATGHPIEARLRFYDPMTTSVVEVGRHALPLAENLTAPLQYTLTDEIPDRKKVPLTRDAIESQLFFVNRYDPNKVPVIFVHGLRCGPTVWKNSINELLADPDLRRRYQPVCFIYPTQLSIPASAARLRELLKRSRDTLDPGHDDPGFGKLVLVGHSMGGLLSRLQVIDSGDEFWAAFFTAPPREIAAQVDAATAKLVRDSLFFRRQSNVKSVVFIGTPHRGSLLADNSLIRTLARILLILPETAGKRLQALTSLPPAYIHPTLRSFHDWGVDGTENLSTQHPFFRALARRPIGVPYHSIIATRNPADFRRSDDGCVPYWSSHLDGAVTETIVPYPHACLEKPATVQSVLKLLRETK